MNINKRKYRWKENTLNKKKKKSNFIQIYFSTFIAMQPETPKIITGQQNLNERQGEELPAYQNFAAPIAPPLVARSL